MSLRTSTTNAALTLLCVSSFFSACTPAVRSFDEGQSVAFGQVEVIADDKKVENLQGIGDVTGAGLVLLRPGEEKAEYIALSGDGEFYWDLGPGRYSIVAFQYLSKGGRRSINLGARFTVPATPTSVYVGDLVVLLNDFYQSVGMADRYEDALLRLASAYPDHPAATAKDLVQFEPPVGTYSAVRAPCAPEWGIECDTHQYGVKPIRPAHRTGDYTVTDSLTPTFEWSPSRRPEVHYDLIIRKSVSCRGTVLFREGLPGEVVVYKENLTTPFYTAEEPLSPGTNYIWSVRFREGDVVSRWSSTGHFTFFIVGYSSSVGDWFRFCTPPTR
jgi:hypothetical protein